MFFWAKYDSECKKGKRLYSIIKWIQNINKKLKYNGNINERKITYLELILHLEKIVVGCVTENVLFKYCVRDWGKQKIQAV